MRAAVYGRQSSNKAKSIDEQIRAGHQVIAEHGWTYTGDYRDGSSASRYAKRERGQWKDVVLAVQCKRFDVLVLWESSRGDRTPETWFAFLASCREMNVRIHVIKDERTYDPNNPRDWKTLAEDGVSNAYESELLSQRTKRGHAGAASAGLPPGGPTPYGYKRTFDPNTGKRIGQVPSEPEAAEVRDIFERLAHGHPVMAVAALKEMSRADIRRIARNRVYVGLRVHNGAEYRGQWEAVVSEVTFYAVQRILDDPSRRITRPGRQLHLLSFLGKCGVCDSWLDQARDYYRCSQKGCVAAPKEEMDQVVTQVVLARLKRRDALEAMFRGDEHEATVAQAQADKLRSRLEEFRVSAALDETTPATLAVMERELGTRIEALEDKARTAGIPLVLKDFLEPGADVEALWNKATLTARRTVVKALCEIRVGKGIPGRASSILRKERALSRLGASRWIGSETTWAETLAG